MYKYEYKVYPAAGDFGIDGYAVNGVFTDNKELSNKEIVDILNSQNDKIDANRKRIAEQDARIAELAKLRRVIGKIPEGKYCSTCDKLNCQEYCRLFNMMVVGINKPQSCLAAFPNGNKGE
jgi:hypothetical protein